MTNWKSITDCCNWDGITCNHFTGDVIGIDVSCGMLRGTIHPNTSLFHLPHLQRLNLAFNDFVDSQLPHEIGRFSNSLTHLNISFCGLTGQVPMGITLFHKLVSLDLSGNMLDFMLEPHVLNILLGNFTVLRELSLGGVNISSVLPTYLNISSSSLKILNLGYTRLHGKLPHNIFNIRFLEKLDLSFNEFTGNIPLEISILPKLISLDLSAYGFGLRIQPHVFNNLLRNSTTLRELSLARVSISSVLPSYLNISSLKTLRLPSTGLRGKFPDNIFNLQCLEQLDLGNNFFTGPLPKHNKSTSIALNFLSLSGNLSLEEIPGSICHLNSLNYLSLSFSGLMGSLPKCLVNLRNLFYLDLSYNMLNGTLPTWLFTLTSLEYIYLSYNMFSGRIPSEIFVHQLLKGLSLGYNQFVGEINVLNKELNSQSFLNLVNLYYVDLRFNNFSGIWELDTLLSRLTNLEVLKLSYSGLSVVTSNYSYYVNPRIQQVYLGSCKLTKIPESLRAMKRLQQLDLSNNLIHGNVPYWIGEIGTHELIYLNLSHNFITGMAEFQWDRLGTLSLQSNQIGGPFHVSICNMSNLQYLDVSNNNIGGLMPQCIGNIGSSIRYLNVKSNMLEGPFPPSICNMNNLGLLDMSNNSFGGEIPQCVRNISSSVLMVDLGNNYFRGPIPKIYDDCGSLEGLILNGNHFEGEIPSSLSKCRYLKVLDLGNNHLNGTFPGWLADLPKLQVIVLKSNNFHGPFETSSTTEFQFHSLRVLDLSCNGFEGYLPVKYFRSFNAMKDMVRKGPRPMYLNIAGKYYSITVAVKHLEQYYSKLLVDFTIIDLSRNKFEGGIPNAISSLKALKVLNLSHNNLNGRIPVALGNLSEIESLDLSWNQLIGEIPQTLVDITTLEVLNLSQNHLMGHIPEGNQFSTFDANSFGGNSGLCGFPLPRNCESPSSPQLVDGDGYEDEDEDENGFTWKVETLGYGCGTLFGLVMGYRMLSTGRPKWFNAIADAGELIIKKRPNKRRTIYIGK